MQHLSRYQRQLSLAEIGFDGQKKLQQAAVLCVGAGGLGSAVLFYLAAAGVGHIGIIDMDTVDESNLQRQILFNEADIGQFKAQCAQRRLQALNSTIHITAYPQALDSANAGDFFKQYPLIIDATDNFTTKYLINDTAVSCNRPWIYGAIQRFDGQVSLFDASQGPCYRCLYPKPPQSPIQNCADAGVIGTIAGLVGVTQAMQAIQWLVGHHQFTPLLGKLWLLNAKNMQTEILTMPKNSNCRVCGHAAVPIHSHRPVPLGHEVVELSVQQIRQLAQVLFIDVREASEWRIGHIDGAKHYPLAQLMQGSTPLLPADKIIIVYCQQGIRSRQAAQILKAQGIANTIYNMDGGYEAWLGRC